MLEPAQYRAGDLWQANEINIAREHLATAVTEAVMGRPCRVRAAPIRHGDARAGGVRWRGKCATSAHGMLADLLEFDGFAMQFLGADVPTDSLLAIVREEGALPPAVLRATCAGAPRAASAASRAPQLRRRCW